MQSALEKQKWSNDLVEFFKSSAFGIGLVFIVLIVFRTDSSELPQEQGSKKVS